MEYAPLVLLAVVAAGAAFLFRYMRRLKQAALQALEETRRLEASVRQAQIAANQATEQARPPEAPPPGNPTGR